MYGHANRQWPDDPLCPATGRDGNGACSGCTMQPHRASAPSSAREIRFSRVIGSVPRSHDHHAATNDGLTSAGDVPGNRSPCLKVGLAQCRTCSCTGSMPTYRFAIEQTPLAIASRVGRQRGGPGLGAQVARSRSVRQRRRWPRSRFMDAVA